MKLTNIPVGLQTDFLQESQSDSIPVITRDGATVFFPAFIRLTTVEQDDTTKQVFKYFQVELPFTGQDLKDYDKCMYQSYSDLRRYFYGPVTVQMEQQLKGTFGAHQYAVRQAFPKAKDEVIPGIERLKDIRIQFWALINEATALAGKTRADLPEVFSSDELKYYAAQWELPTEAIINYTIQFTLISTNLLQNCFNWSDLFVED